MDPKLYSPGPEGTFNITLDNGETTPVRLSEDKLQSLGYRPAGSAPAPMPGPDMGGGAGGAGSMGPPVEAPPAQGGAPAFGASREIAPSSVTQPIEQAGGAPHSSGVEAQTGVKRDAEPGKAKPGQLDTSGGTSGGGFAMQRGPVRRIPGKDMRASWQIQKGVATPEEVKEDLAADDRAETSEGRAMNVAALREQQMNDRESHLLDQREMLDQQRARRTQIDEQIKKKQDLIAQRDKEAESMTPKSASDVLADKGILAQLGAAIAITIGGYQQGLTGRQNNVGLDLVNQAIKSEIDKQREQYERAKAAGKEARNDYAQALELYGTPEAAEQDMEMRRLAIAEKMITNRGEQIGTEEYLGAAHNAAQEFRNQRAQTRLALSDRERDKVVENWVRTPDQYTGGGAAALKPEQRKRMVILPDGTRGFVVDEGARQPLQDKLTAGRDVLSAIGKLQRLAQDNTLSPGDARTQYKALIADIAPVINVGKGQGAMSNDEYQRMTDLLGDPNAIFQSRGAALDVAAQGVQGRMDGVVRDNVYQDPDAMVPMRRAGPKTQSNM